MSGPGGHPGVVIVPLTDNVSDVAQQLEAALAAGRTWKFNYRTALSNEYAVLWSGYNPQQPNGE